MKANTLIKLPDGRVGRTVYHNLDGYGIAFGFEAHDVDELPPPDAMLRELYAEHHEYEMVGDEFEIIPEPDEA